MKKLLQYSSHTKGSVTAETCICSAVMIILFSLFLTITGYCRCYVEVKTYLDLKVKETALFNYTTGFDVPVIIPSGNFAGVSGNLMKNLFIYSAQQNDEIVMTASYKYISLFGNFSTKIHSGFTKWEGDGNGESTVSVWELPPAARGKKIEELFGGGLPEFFPVLDSHNKLSGRAVSIVSINITLPVYESGTELYNIIKEKTDQLASFTRGECDGVVITDENIFIRELVVVIPENPMSEAQYARLDEACVYAGLLDIYLKFERYQKVQ